MTNLIHDISIWKIPIGLAFPPQQISDHLSDDNFARQQNVTSIHNSISDEIPPLEEDWENGQFTDADTDIINRQYSLRK